MFLMATVVKINQRAPDDQLRSLFRLESSFELTKKNVVVGQMTSANDVESCNLFKRFQANLPINESLLSFEFEMIFFFKLTLCFKTKNLSPVNIYSFFGRNICLYAFYATQYQMECLNATLEFA